jgi:hypothetical protein
MKIRLEFDLDQEEIDIDEGEMPLNPRELGEAFVRFMSTMDKYGELRNPTLVLPYCNDDVEDIIEVIRATEEGLDQPQLTITQDHSFD